jgi:two-component system, NarL family, sensor histidine kinase UhpB
VSERVVRERELSARIEEGERRLADERSAKEIAEENARLKGHNELLSQEGRELQHLNQTRAEYLHRMISAQEEEKKRIARDIHDQLGQQLTGLRLSLTALKESLHQGNNPTYYLEKLDSIARSIDTDVDFISAELRVGGLDDLGLEQALRQFVEQWSSRFGVRAEFHSSGFHRLMLPPDVSINLYRITQEALNNTVKHAGACNVSVLLENRNGSVVLIIEDDGVGFDVNENHSSPHAGRGVGLIGMKERTALVGGTIEIESTKNRGTTIYVRIDQPEGN